MVSCGKWKYDSLLNFFETFMESKKVLKDVQKADSWKSFENCGLFQNS